MSVLSFASDAAISAKQMSLWDKQLPRLTRAHEGHVCAHAHLLAVSQLRRRLGGVEDVLRSMLERRNLTNRNPTPATAVSNGDPSSLIPTTADAAVVANISNPNATHPIPTITAAATAATAATTLNHNNNSNSGGPSHTGRLPNSVSASAGGRWLRGQSLGRLRRCRTNVQQTHWLLMRRRP